ncbi:MAG: hypothetical protein IPM64_00745 [Phycisphaerales bacterium]|nr:hypothetical protein [Phycisphaerales bacterium]
MSGCRTSETCPRRRMPSARAECAQRGPSGRRPSAIGGRPRLIARLLIAAGGLVHGSAVAQPATEFMAQRIAYDFASGPQSNPAADRLAVFGNTAAFPGAHAVRLTLAELILNPGDQLRLISRQDGIEQIITADDPQFSHPGYHGEFTSIIFNGDAVDFELVLAPGSDAAQYRILSADSARYVEIEGGIATICGAADNRTLQADTCTVRIVNSGFGWGTGNMLGSNCMVTAGHVMGGGPWTVQRNVPASTASGIPVFPAASDQFTVPALTPTTGILAPGCPNNCVAGNDWAVVRVPDNITGPPGTGCNPTYNCAFTHQTNDALSSRGYGISATATRNGVLKGAGGPAHPGAPPPFNNPPEFRHRIDTTRGDSGSAVRDSSNRIVGFHSFGGCTANNNGYNGGTLLTNAQMLTALCTICTLQPCGDQLPGACCYVGNCQVRGPCECAAIGGTFQGPGTTCTPNPCPAVANNGACCISGMPGTCQIATAAECATLGGAYAGDGTNCGPPAPCLGACCEVLTGTCNLDTPIGCITSGGSYQGDGTTCVPNPCNSGACCLSGQCFVRSAADCAAGGGVFQGAATACAPNPCPAPGAACCMGANLQTCNIRTQAACATAGGTWLGVGVSCAINLCRVPGACCLPNGTCNYVLQGVCDEQRGRFLGNGSLCAPNPCTVTGACCPGNGGACVVVTRSACFLTLQGLYFGDGTTCAPNPCTAANIGPFVPPNDLCANAVPPAIPGLTPTILSPPRSHTTRFSGVDAGAPVCNAITPGTGGVWFSLAGNGRSVTVSTCVNVFPYQEPYDSILSVYCGTCPGLTCVTANDDNAACTVSNRLSSVTFCTETGATYFILVHGFNGAVGDFRLQVTTSANCCVATVACAPTGACCFPDGTCAIRSASNCACQGGVYRGNGSTCAPNPCPGACCVDGLCSWRESLECALLGGTYYGNGSTCVPSPCEHACCFENGSCQMLTTAVCLAANGDSWGPLSSCTPNPCVPAFGACCLFTGGCNTLTQADCASLGTYQGGGTNCMTLDCATVVGACCFDEHCTMLRELPCLYLQGNFRGLGAPCSPNPCIAPVGACCYSFGLCAVVSAAQCQSEGGAYLGDGTDCESGDCDPYYGACCLPAGGCTVVADADCAAQGGSFQGFGTDCNSGPCDFVPCCFADGSCAELHFLVCDIFGGSPGFPGEACATTACPQPAPCAGSLPGDANCDGVVNNFDIDGYVYGLLFTSSPIAPAGYLDVVAGGDDCWKNRVCWGDVNCDSLFNNLDIDPFVVCVLAPPPPATGCPSCPPQACCLPFGCFETQPAHCHSLGGLPGGLGTDCGTVVCPP